MLISMDTMSCEIIFVECIHCSTLVIGSMLYFDQANECSNDSESFDHITLDIGFEFDDCRSSFNTQRQVLMFMQNHTGQINLNQKYISLLHRIQIH